ncbi:MAG: phosphomethylpyrimidine synthase ThiC [Armatimonadota bacterium]|nr:phosphomethylpyrimidine synthase ThiC [Armatimonadota bacterium]
MTQLESARAGKITPEMKIVAEQEHLDAEVIRSGVAEGIIVIPANVNAIPKKPCGIGKGLRTKVNANIGTSADFQNLDDELEKLRVAIETGADTAMDLSTGGNLAAIRKAIISNCTIPLGTVPIYEAAVKAAENGSVAGMSEDQLFEVIERNAEDGVDFITVHCGITRESLRRLREAGRITDVVSRGGAFLVCWMLQNDRENPLYARFDDLLEICRKHDVTLSLGDGMRPGCLADATDRPQIQELIILGELVDRARKAGVQVMVEGPGHVPMHQIAANIQLEKTICKGAPFYVLGPLVTDVAPGYDHITSAIGGAIAAAAGADFLCYVTPSEHLGLPGPDEVRVGVAAARIAAHAADIAKGIPSAIQWDNEMSAARKARNWQKQAELALDPIAFKKYRTERAGRSEDVCSMCSQYCAMKVVDEYLRRK